jgi:hypothetical protein
MIKFISLSRVSSLGIMSLSSVSSLGIITFTMIIIYFIIIIYNYLVYIMATQFNTTNYSQLNADITDIMRSGTYSGVTISIYTDADATTFAVDGNAPLENKKISKLNTTGSYTITASNLFVNAALEVVFDDSSSFKSFDNIDEHWYKIDGILFNRRKF